MSPPNVTIQKILYTTDLSENARPALAYAVSVANAFGARIVILNVVEETPELVDQNVMNYIGAEAWETIKKRNLDEAREVLIGKKRSEGIVREVLDRFCEQLRPGTDDHAAAMDETLVVQGNPVQEILRVAEEKRCDLIVMGSHGRGAVLDTMMGSTTSRVLRRSNIPVLVVRLPKPD